MSSIHSFHIPVMGTGFTVDTPLKVARYGVNSVISIMDDKLLEKIRWHYSSLRSEPYEPITGKDPQSRVGRIREYLNFIQRAVQADFADLSREDFGTGGDIDRYFELCDPESRVGRQYAEMRTERDPKRRRTLERHLRESMAPGSIDVNIMTKVDREPYSGAALRHESDALTALRGFAESRLHSSVVFSAGVNPRLFAYLEEFPDFFPTAGGPPKKGVTLKVSDFRSAAVQGKMLAKKGVWVGEFRVESGLNCGGHAFPTEGLLLGSVLEEFCQKRAALQEELSSICAEALRKKGLTSAGSRTFRLTAQGGVGTPDEHRFLIRQFGLDSVGWGTPFLLVPEATSVDSETLQKLAAAGVSDIRLSDCSPLGVPFWTLKNSSSEEARLARIAENRPGSPCPNKCLAFNPEFGEPLCVSSSRYQEAKIRRLEAESFSREEFERERARVVEKACICRDLGDGALLHHGLNGIVPRTPAICPGPNLVFFSRICSLKEMIGHIYGIQSVIERPQDRPHMFINEARLYLDHLKRLLFGSAQSAAAAGTTRQFVKNFREGLAHIQNMANDLVEEKEARRLKLLGELDHLRREFDALGTGL